MKTMLQFLILLWTALLVGCSPVIQDVPIPENNIAPTKVSEKTSIQASSLSDSQCHGSQIQPPTNVEGNFVLSGDYWLSPDPSNKELYTASFYILYNRLKNRQVFLKEESDGRIEYFSVSPNKKMLAFYTQGKQNNGDIDVSDPKQNHLVIISGNGDVIKEYYNHDMSWYSLVAWLDDSHLLLSKFAGTQAPYPSIILDPFSGTKEELKADYPGIYSNSVWLWSWDEYASIETIYNPEQSLVVYPETPSKLILWDLKSNKLLKEITALGATSNPPMWLSNGKEFIINLSTDEDDNYPPQEELVSIHASGEVTQLTHLLDQSSYIEIDRYSKSADERYIAFWFRDNAAFWFHDAPATVSDVFQLAIYDRETKETKIYCVNTLPNIQAPVWSPTEHQLLVAGFLDSTESYGTIWVDVDNERISYIEKGVIPIGWMLGNP